MKPYMFSRVIAFLCLLGSIAFFAYSSEIGYRQHSETRRAFVEHPEFIPDAQLV